MVKRLLGFVLLIGVVALLLQWVSLRQSEPEKDVEVQVTVAPEEPPKEAPAPEPSTPPALEPSIPPAAEQTPPAPPAPAETPPDPPASTATDQAPEASPPAAEPPAEPEPSPAPTDEQGPSDPPAAERDDSASESEPPAPAATEREAPASPATDEEAVPPAADEVKPPLEPEPSAPSAAEQTPTSPSADETAAPAEPEPPSAPTTEPTQSAPPAAESGASSTESEPLPPSAGKQATAEAEEPPAALEPPVTPAAGASAVPSEPEPSSPAETQIEERVVPEEEFVAIEQAQGRTDERTDAQRRHQDQDGWYGWGVLADYADPDRAARLLGGAAVVQRQGSFFTLRESTGGRVTARPIANVSAAYGSVALRGHGSAFKQRLRSALSTGQLLGREADYKLWYLFPRREATHLGNKVVAVFECHVRESALSGAAAERFRKESKLRGAVLALRRANGGRLGIYLPRYFQTVDRRVPVAEACRALDEESRRLGS